MKTSTLAPLVRYSLLGLMLWMSTGAQVAAQQRERPTPKRFSDQIWYGGSFGLGFVGGNQFSQFNFGIFPMAGYKLTPWFSVGPRLGVDYNYYKAPSATSLKQRAVNVFGYYAGVFARARIYRSFFAQTEYGFDMGAFPRFTYSGLMEVDDNDRPVKHQVTQEHGFIGLGYNSGGTFASEILVLYDLLVAENSPLSPWNYRIGFTYRF